MHMIATDVIFPSYLFSWTKHTHKEIVQQFIALFQMKEIITIQLFITVKKYILIFICQLKFEPKCMCEETKSKSCTGS